MIATVKKLKVSLILLSWILLIQNGYTATMIDDFSSYQEVTNGTNGAQSISSPLLTNLTRTITATASSDQDAETDVVVDDFDDTLNISNNSDSTGTASIQYSFDTIDLTSGVDGLIFNLQFSDLFHEIQIIANHDSTYGFASLGGPGEYLISFSQFTNPLVFQALNSLEINFRGVKNWDAVYGSISTHTTVPEPSLFALLGIGLMLMRPIRTRRTVEIK
jgi:hypothetical protein